jgi:alpha-L-fucosidase
VRQLVETASKGGDYLLNVGPKANGRFPIQSVKRLKRIGQWMEANGESIYATRARPIGKPEWDRATVKQHEDGDGATLYLHVFDWPDDGKLSVPRLESEIASATLLANGKAMKVSQSGDEPGRAGD